MKKCFLSFLLLFLFSDMLLFSQLFSFPGSGTDIDPYQIWCETDFKELADSTYDIWTVTWTKGKHIRLMNNIDLGNSIFGLVYWYGYFYGNGKTVTRISETFICSILGSYSANTVGFIDSLIVNGYFYTDQIAAGGIVGNIYYGSTISNCINNATVYNGGAINKITGKLEGPAAGIAYSNSGTISNCINNGDITGVDNVGGIAGDNQSGTIINCINTGKITATNSGSAPHGVSGVGGIAAYHKNNISNCINLGTVEGQNNVGGIVGWASPLGNTASQITNCINYGYIKGTNAVGGIVGLSYNNIPNISNCINAGVVEGSSDVGSITGKE